MTSLSERQINERRRWKAETFDFDHYIPDNSSECSYCLTDLQAELIRGIIKTVGWRTRWFSPTDTPIDNDLIEQFQNDIVRRLIVSCCDEPPIQFRFDPETGQYQKSTDGGATWTDASEFDPRETSTIHPPPSAFGFSTTKCQNADSMVQYIKGEMIDSINEDMAISAILGVVGTALLALATGGTFLFFSGLLDAVVSGIFAFGIVAWQAAFTTTVYDDLRCAIFNNMDSDDSIDDAGMTALLAYINSHFTGIVVPTLYGYVNGMGRVGATNAIRANRGDPDADCSACAPTCSSDNWFNGLIVGGSPSPRGTVIDSGDDYLTITSVDRGDGVQVVVVTSLSNDICCGTTYEVLAGNAHAENAPTNWAYIPCGTSREYTNFTPQGLTDLSTTPQNARAFNSSEPFTMKVTFV